MKDLLSDIRRENFPEVARKLMNMWGGSVTIEEIEAALAVARDK